MTSPTTITVTLPQIAKMIDHSLLHPTLTDKEILSGLKVAKALKVAAACVKPYSVPIAADVLAGSGVSICAVIGFPHGNSTTAIKVLEAEECLREGAHEIDMVVNVGKVLGDDWEYVTNEIRAINDVVTKQHSTNTSASANAAILKVIFENDFLEEEHIAHLCKICSALSVAFVKTSTGYGFVKHPGGRGLNLYTYKGATVPHILLMKANVGPSVGVKAAGGIRTLDEVLLAMTLGVSRIGASATEAILEEAVARGIGATPVQVSLRSSAAGIQGGVY
ncbi:deoxyribose-phosphate aldolase [Xylariaceae sp. AK1471]|nr:deoxyribose-phosphate aldolase [Xylariaceae sp. AK1471]